MTVICGRWPPPMPWSWVWMLAVWTLQCTLAFQVCSPLYPPPPFRTLPCLLATRYLSLACCRCTPFVPPCPCSLAQCSGPPLHPPPPAAHCPPPPPPPPAPLRNRRHHNSSWEIFHQISEGKHCRICRLPHLLHIVLLSVAC